MQKVIITYLKKNFYPDTEIRIVRDASYDIKGFDVDGTIYLTPFKFIDVYCVVNRGDKSDLIHFIASSNEKNEIIPCEREREYRYPITVNPRFVYEGIDGIIGVDLKSSRFSPEEDAFDVKKISFISKNRVIVFNCNKKTQREYPFIGRALPNTFGYNSFYALTDDNGVLYYKVKDGALSDSFIYTDPDKKIITGVEVASKTKGNNDSFFTKPYDEALIISFGDGTKRVIAPDYKFKNFSDYFSSIELKCSFVQLPRTIFNGISVNNRDGVFDDSFDEDTKIIPGYTFVVNGPDGEEQELYVMNDGKPITRSNLEIKSKKYKGRQKTRGAKDGSKLPRTTT